VQSSESRLIEWLRAAVLSSEHFGDPRKPANRNNWALVPDDARRRFMQWLAKEDLRFFFEAVMANTPDPHGRQAFWSRYLDSDRLVDSCVALSTADMDFLRSRGLLKRDQAYSRAVGAQDSVSAFLLRFRTSTGDVIAIEFSQAGNAAYFHDGNEFDRRMGGLHRPQFDIVAHLKNTITELDPPPGFGMTWDWHRQGWQDKFRRALSYYLR
jgi:hypothetical protein